MIKRKVTKLIGLKFDDFQIYRENKQIIAQEARLIPLLKTGDEGALSSIFLSAVKLVKEYRDSFFKETKLSRSGKAYFYTEVVFNDIDSSCRPDGLIIIVSKGVIKDALIFEMKNKNTGISKDQVEKYINLCKKLGVNKVATVSNEFVSDSKQSPVKIKCPKNFSLFHFSWTYLMTKGQLLLFKNDAIIKDDDQIEIMKEVLHYFDGPTSGVTGYHMMQPGWKETVDKVTNRMPIKTSDLFVSQAVCSWHEEEKDMALLLSRKLGVLVKSTIRNKESLKNDVKRLINDQELYGSLSIKNSVSDIKVKVDFEVKTVSMSVKVTPPLNKGTLGRITWLSKQLEAAKKKNETTFSQIEKDILIEANIKHARAHITVGLSEFEKLIDETKGKEIQAFNVVVLSKFNTAFGSNKKFILKIEKMVLDYYAGIVQYLTNWNQPAPKL